MARPTPLITAVADVITLPTASILLDGSGSLPSAGATSITAYQWVLLSKPAGSAAALTDATTATPTLTNVDTIGDYNIFLKVTDDAGRKSFETPYGVQHLPPEDLVTFDVPLYAFEMPVAGAFLVVKAPYVSGAARLNTSLYKPAPGEFGWLGHGLWTAIDLVDELRGEALEIYNPADKELLADKLSPQTPGAGVTVDGLNIKDTGAVTALDSNRAAIYSLDDFTVAAGKTLKIEATGDLLVDQLGATSGGDVTSSAAIYTPELKTPLVNSVAALALNAATDIFIGASHQLVVNSTGLTSFTTDSGGFGIDAVGDVNVYASDAVNVVALGGPVTLTSGTGDIVATTPQAKEFRIASVVGMRNVINILTTGGFVTPNNVETTVPLSTAIEFPAGLHVGDVVMWDLLIDTQNLSLPSLPLTLRMYMDVDHPGDPWSGAILEQVATTATGSTPGSFNLPLVWRGSAVLTALQSIRGYGVLSGGASDYVIHAVDSDTATVTGAGAVTSPFVLRVTADTPDPYATVEVIAGTVTVKRAEAW